MSGLTRPTLFARIAVSLFCSLSFLCFVVATSAQTKYDASLGTLPQVQGFIYSGDSYSGGTNPSPFVSGSGPCTSGSDCVLHETTTAGAQYWLRLDPTIDFSHFVLEATLRVNSSNYIANVGTGTREGYYLGVHANSGEDYSIGLASAGFNINTILVPNHPLTQFAIADGNFHKYRLSVQNHLASFFIDGTKVADNIPPSSGDFGTGSEVLFGGTSAGSRSDTELKTLCYNTTTSSSCSGCQVTVRPVAQDPGPQYMKATFVAPNPSTLLDYARACGYSSFDWQQKITVDPGGSTIRPNNPSLIPQNIAPDGSLIAPPPYYDPPSGGYTGGVYTNFAPYNPYPFYYPSYPSDYFTPGTVCTIPNSVFCPLILPFVVSSDGTTLSFLDAPAHLNLSGETPATNPHGKFLGFSTSLVGVVKDNAGNVTNITSLYSWTWNSTFNGSAGEADQTTIFYPIDPGSGTGGITITSINGAPQSPPSVSCTATSTTPQPHNRKSVLVTISGTIIPGTQVILTDGTTYAVADEDGRARQSGIIALGVGGSYSFTVSLGERRHMRDDDEREFAVVVTARDQIGNARSCSVTIPHHDDNDPHE